MAWETFTSRDGIYAVDWEGVGRLIRSYARSEATLENARVNTESHWFGPNLHTVDVDWDKVRQRTLFHSESLLRSFYYGAQVNMQTQLTRLFHMVDATRVNTAKFQEMMRGAQRQTMANIENSVERGESAIKVARVTRDFSAEFVMVSATLISGGTALALGGLATGAGLKATARAQDDPHATKTNIAATFVTEFAVGCLDLKAGKAIAAAGERAAEEVLKRAIGGEAARKLEAEAAKKGTKFALMMLYNHGKLGLEPAKAVLQGKTFQNGLVTGGLKTVGGIHGEILKYLILDDERFPKLAALADASVSFGMDKLSDFLIERSKGPEPREPKAPKIKHLSGNQHELLDAVAYERQMIERVAVCQIASAGASSVGRWPQMQSANRVKH